MNEEIARDRTILASVCSVLLVIPAFIPAGIVVVLYTGFLRSYVSDSWIPYLEKISLVWFPELLRGIIVGSITFYAAKQFFKQFNRNIVRAVVMAFWSAIMLLLVIFNISNHGLTLDIIGGAALLIGLGLGLWMDELENK